jgi:hypothetical protein
MTDSHRRPYEVREYLIAHRGEWAIAFEGALSGCYSRARAVRGSLGNWAGHSWLADVERVDDRRGILRVRHVSDG